jgi:ubiquinone biosynthesis protein UbiJ
MQKTFFEVFKQNQGEYMGSVLTGWLESMLPMVKSDGELELGDETFSQGLAKAVKDNDQLFPPEWRMSMRARKGAAAATSEVDEIRQLREQLEATQARLRELERKLANG